MSQNYYFYDNRTQNVNSDQTSLAATLMSHPTSLTTNTITSCGTSRTTHCIENSHNNDNSIGSSSNINTTSLKKSLINPGLVKLKHYSKVSSILWNVKFYFLPFCLSLYVWVYFNPLILFIDGKKIVTCVCLTNYLLLPLNLWCIFIAF